MPDPVLPVHGPVLTQSFSGHVSARAVRSWCSSCTAPDLSADILKGEGRSPMWTSGESVCATVQCCGQTASGESRSWTSSIHSHTHFRLHTNSPVPGPVLALLSPGQVSTILSPHVHVRRTLRSWCSSCMAPDLSAGLFKGGGSLPMWTSGTRVCANEQCSGQALVDEQRTLPTFHGCTQTLFQTSACGQAAYGE